MLYSMTGFTRYSQHHGSYTSVWEIRSVNSKYVDLKWRLPSFLRSYEQEFEKTLRSFAKRGKIEISLDVQFHQDAGAGALNLDRIQVNHMIGQIAQLAKEHHVLFQPDFNRFFGMPHLWTSQLDENANLLDELQISFGAALEDWNKSRHIEGLALADDLKKRIKLMSGWVEVFSGKALPIKEERLRILKERLKSMLEALDSELQEQRFLQECVILADKTDVSEEITRLSAHLKRLIQLLDTGTDTGRKLDFTLQEAFREINTLGNKIQDMELSPVIVDFKTELEKCREQAQNIE